MPGSDGERLAVVEQRLHDLAERIAEHLRKADERSDRVRELEAAVGLLVEAHKQTRRADAEQYRRLEVRLARLTVAVMCASVLVSLVVAFIPR